MPKHAPAPTPPENGPAMTEEMLLSLIPQWSEGVVPATSALAQLLAKRMSGRPREAGTIVAHLAEAELALQREFGMTLGVGELEIRPL